MSVKRSHLGRGAIAIALGTAVAAAAAADPEIPAREAAECGQALGLDLYRIFASQDGNVFFSPYSVSEALALLSSGAAGKTQEEILRTLHWTRSADRLATDFGEQDKRVDRGAQDNLTLTVANGIWYQRGQQPRATFLERAQTDFRADIRVADFSADLPVSQHMINYWVERKTGGKIANLVPPGALTPRTRLVLANAIYFKGRWASPFKAELTAPRPFYTANGQSVMTATMRQKAPYRTARTEVCDLLELPYAGGALSMVILLPRTRDGIGSLEQNLTLFNLPQWLGQLDSAPSQETELSMPRYKLTFSVELTKALAQLGMVTAFVDLQADFSPINGKRDLYVSSALHKAFIDVNEEGTEAAAATAFGLQALAVVRPQAFNVDHPFLFLIRDRATGSLLFLGRMQDPPNP
jgi:serine protease inhibitor